MIVCDRCGAGKDGGVLSCRVDIKISYGSTVIGRPKCDNKTCALNVARSFPRPWKRPGRDTWKQERMGQVPDIAMCPGDGCSVKDKCYRHVAVPSGDRQAWMVTPEPSGEWCEYFWEVGERKDVRSPDNR